jgi:mRNA interferase MazF
MKRGEVWVANLNPPRGRETGKIRPVLVVQADALDSSVTPLVVVLPLTTQVRPGLRLWRVTVAARDRLRQDCQVMLDQPRALDRARLGDGPLTSLTASEMASVEQGLRLVLGMH